MSTKITLISPGDYLGWYLSLLGVNTIESHIFKVLGTRGIISNYQNFEL